jgi:hypothetical protein
LVDLLEGDRVLAESPGEAEAVAETLADGALASSVSM